MVTEGQTLTTAALLTYPQLWSFSESLLFWLLEGHDLGSCTANMQGKSVLEMLWLYV